jgi:hypothetical protein
MPQVSQQFGPIYQTVVLDGSGNGAVSFQAVGSAIRITNIFFRVSSQSAQAVCTIYKGQIADGNMILNSNSGSTGGNAKGNVDLFDGETAYVRWTGGDPGATATATFTGEKVNFSEIRASTLDFEDPIAAGDGSLIFPALKSPNYVPGVSGWQLTRDGDFEGNDVVVRGEIDIVGNNGSEFKIYTAPVGVTETAAIIEYWPGDYPDLAYPAPDPGRFQAGSVLLPDHAGRLRVISPLSGTAQAYMDLYGGTEEGGVDTAINLFARSIGLFGEVDATTPTQIRINGYTTYTDYGVDSGKGVIDVVGASGASAAITTTETALVTSNTIVFKAGRAYEVMCSGGATMSVAGRAVNRVRKTSTAGQELGLYGSQFVNTSLGNGNGAVSFYVSGSDVTCELVWTSIVASGATSVTYSANRFIKISDIGPSDRVSDWGGPQLV